MPERVVAGVEHNNPKSFPNAPADVQNFLIGASVAAVRRRAKVLLVDLSSNYTLVIHLKMTGQLVYVGKQKLKAESEGSERSINGSDQRFGGGHPNDSLIGVLPDKSTRVEITFTDGSKLFFNDQRKFGWMRLLPTPEVPNIDFMKRVGPEPLEADFTWQVMRERLERRKNTNIKAAILDQSVLAGVGNIYADESLWGAKIHPSTLVKDISDAQIKALHGALVDVLNLSIEMGGSSNRNYVDAEGKKGSYMKFAKVFRREGLACPRCGTVIEKIRVAGRGTHFCPTCQKLS